MGTTDRHLLLGAHLRPEDAAVEGVVTLPAARLTVSAIAIGARDNLADRAIVARAASVRQELARREIFVAIRYGATAADAAEAERKVSPHAAKWTELLERWRGHAELTMKIGGGGKAPRPERAAFSSGAEYLRALQALRAVPANVASFADVAEKRLRDAAAAVRRVRREDGAIEIALLVERDRIEEARTAAETLIESSGGIPFFLSGPWPLEVFADE